MGTLSLTDLGDSKWLRSMIFAMGALRAWALDERTMTSDELFKAALYRFVTEESAQRSVWEMVKGNGLSEIQYKKAAVKNSEPVYFNWLRVTETDIREYPNGIPQSLDVEIFIQNGRVFVGTPIRTDDLGRIDQVDHDAIRSAFESAHKSICELLEEEFEPVITNSELYRDEKRFEE